MNQLAPGFGEQPCPDIRRKKQVPEIVAVEARTVGCFPGGVVHSENLFRRPGVVFKVFGKPLQRQAHGRLAVGGPDYPFRDKVITPQDQGHLPMAVVVLERKGDGV